MALNAPDFYAGSLDVERGAINLFQLAGWIRRRCNEIIDEPEMDILKLYDLCHLCNRLRTEADNWIDAGDITLVLDKLIDITRQSGKGNVDKSAVDLNQDYKDLYIVTGNWLTWATTNLPGVDEVVTNPTATIKSAVGDGFKFTVTTPKVPALTAQVQAILAIYA